LLTTRFTLPPALSALTLLHHRLLLHLVSKFDRSGRSTGTAWVTYLEDKHAAKAKEAFNGAMAKGASTSPLLHLHVSQKRS